VVDRATEYLRERSSDRPRGNQASRPNELEASKR